MLVAPGNRFAGFWQARRTPWDLTSGGPGSGLYVSRDGGESWTAYGAGLPADFYAAVLRDAAHVVAHGDDAALAFGTRNGHVYASLDGGTTYTEVARDLPDVLSVRVWPS